MAGLEPGIQTPRFGAWMAGSSQLKAGHDERYLWVVLFEARYNAAHQLPWASAIAGTRRS